MDDPEQTVTIARIGRGDMPAEPWGDDQLADADNGSVAESAGGLASLSFIIAALRRRARLWLIVGAVGLLLGIGVYVREPPPYQATTSVLLTPSPGDDPDTAILTDQALAQSRPVAALALHKLALHSSVTSFLSGYSVANVTNQVLLFTVRAQSSAEAVRRAQDLATEFLQFRADQLWEQERSVASSLSEQVAQAKQQVAGLNSQVTQVAAEPASSQQAVKLRDVRDQRNQARISLITLEQTIQSSQATLQVGTTNTVQGSKVLNVAAPVLQSRVKMAGIYGAAGFIGGLALGLGFVIVHALISGRLRRRDDIAHALGASVRLSVGRIRLRGLRRRGWLARAQDRNIERIVAHLRDIVPEGSKDTGTVTLAVVPVDSIDVAALSAVALAVSRAERGQRVILADLSDGARAAQLLDTVRPGVRAVSAGAKDTRLVVVVPDDDEAVPFGPVDHPSSQTYRESASDALVAAYAAADLLLTLAPLDPALGGDHLPTWAAKAAVMVTAGRSSWTKIHAAGEMIRLAGASVISAIVVGADKADESLGVSESSEQAANPDVSSAELVNLRPG